MKGIGAKNDVSIIIYRFGFCVITLGCEIVGNGCFIFYFYNLVDFNSSLIFVMKSKSVISQSVALGLLDPRVHLARNRMNSDTSIANIVSLRLVYACLYVCVCGCIFFDQQRGSLQQVLMHVVLLSYSFFPP